MINQRRIGHSSRVMHFLHSSLLIVNHIRYVRNSGNHIHIKLTIQSFLHNFHVKQSQESAKESEAQRQRRFWLKGQRRIVQLKFFQRSTQILIIFRLNRVNSGKDHRFYFLKPIDCLITRTTDMCNGISYLHLFRSLDTGNNVSYIPRTQLFPRNHIHFQYTDFVGIIFFSCIEEFHLITCTNHSVYYLKICNNTTE